MRATTTTPTDSGAGMSARARRWSVYAAATVVAGFLMTTYVQLLNQSVARGAHWRYSQTTLPAGTLEAPSARGDPLDTRR